MVVALGPLGGRGNPGHRAPPTPPPPRLLFQEGEGESKHINFAPLRPTDHRTLP